jgi:uncharacterized protein
MSPSPEHDDGRRVHWDGRKWPDRLHWQFEMTRLGADEHGTWFSIARGETARRGTEAPVPIPHSFVSLVPSDTWWEVEFYATHPLWELYVNIGTPCEWRGSTVRQVDLDLDVVRTRAGTIEVLDEDEFADHQRQFGYPPAVIEGAQRATAEVIDLLTRRAEPFDAAAGRWLEAAGLVIPD